MRNLQIGTDLRQINFLHIEAASIVRDHFSDLARRFPMLASPLIGAALSAGLPWLGVYCAGCRTERCVDLREIDRHRGASVESLIPALACTWCPGTAPLPR